MKLNLKVGNPTVYSDPNRVWYKGTMFGHKVSHILQSLSEVEHYLINVVGMNKRKVKGNIMQVIMNKGYYTSTNCQITPITRQEKVKLMNGENDLINREYDNRC